MSNFLVSVQRSAANNNHQLNTDLQKVIGSILSTKLLRISKSHQLLFNMNATRC